MQAALAVQRAGFGPARAAASRRRPATSRRLAVAVRAHDDDDVLPIWSGRLPDAPDAAKVPKSKALGGKTLGEELEIMRREADRMDEETEQAMTQHLYSSNWQGDVYVGSNVNILTVIMGLIFFVPIFGLLFAYLSYGTLWTGHYYGI